MLTFLKKCVTDTNRPLLILMSAINPAMVIVTSFFTSWSMPVVLILAAGYAIFGFCFTILLSYVWARGQHNYYANAEYATAVKRLTAIVDALHIKEGEVVRLKQEPYGEQYTLQHHSAGFQIASVEEEWLYDEDEMHNMPTPIYTIYAYFDTVDLLISKTDAASNFAYNNTDDERYGIIYDRIRMDLRSENIPSPEEITTLCDNLNACTVFSREKE